MNPTKAVRGEISRGRMPTLSTPGTFISLKNVMTISAWPFATIAVATFPPPGTALHSSPDKLQLGFDLEAWWAGKMKERVRT